MTKQDNPTAKTTEAPAKDTVEVKMAPLQASIEDRLALLERRAETPSEHSSPVRRAPPVNGRHEVVPLHVCNHAHHAAMVEVRAERSTAYEAARKALEGALKRPRFAGAKRLQKDLVHHTTEARAALPADKK